MNKRTGLNHPPVTVKRAVIERDGGFCLYVLPGCQGEASTTDHRANRQAGGSRVLNHPGNLAAICWACNTAKADAHALTLLDLEERGLWVRAGATHAATLQRVLETPVMDLEGRRWLLIDEHTRKEIS